MNTSEKPLVRYTELEYTPVTGISAILYGLDHPRLGECWIQTSMVLSYDKETDTIETMNTVYVRDRV